MVRACLRAFRVVRESTGLIALLARLSVFLFSSFVTISVFASTFDIGSNDLGFRTGPTSTGGRATTAKSYWVDLIFTPQKTGTISKIQLRTKNAGTGGNWSATVAFCNDDGTGNPDYGPILS